MEAKKIRVLVVDDSALMREMIADCLQAASGIEVVGQARDGQHALELVESLRPDLVTLDVQMPRMDGLQTLDAILSRHPLPVIMVSSLTQRGATTTLEALDRGALDYVAKPESLTSVDAQLRDELVRKVRTMAGTDVRRVLQIRKERQNRAPVRLLPEAAPAATSGALASEVASSELENSCIAIGISTGGPPALSQLFEQLRAPLPPIVVVQHMPAHFTKPFAWRLNSLSQLTIKEAETGDSLRANHVYIAPGGQHLAIRKEAGMVRCRVQDGDPVSGHKPSVDVMMQSVVQVFGRNVLGVIMTGMGRDGADGCKLIRAKGGFVLGQDEASSDVYGMNKVALVEGGVDRQFHLDEAARVITASVRRAAGQVLCPA